MTAPVVVTGRRRPHQVALLAASVVLGVTFLAGWAPSPSTVDAVAPIWFRPLWYGLLLSSGLLGLAAAWLPDLRTGLLLERVSMFVSTCAVAMYVVPIFAVAGLRGVGAGCLLGFWALANIWRFAQITSDLRRIRSKR